MQTAAQKRATSKYQKEKVKQICLRFFPADIDLYNKLQEKVKNGDGLNKYIKDLIRKDLEP